jgi:hypothetical protein
MLAHSRYPMPRTCDIGVELHTNRRTCPHESIALQKNSTQAYSRRLSIYPDLRACSSASTLRHNASAARSTLATSSSMSLLSFRSSSDGIMRSSNPTVRERRPAGGSTGRDSRVRPRSTTGGVYWARRLPALFRRGGRGASRLLTSTIRCCAAIRSNSSFKTRTTSAAEAGAGSGISASRSSSLSGALSARANAARGSALLLRLFHAVACRSCAHAPTFRHIACNHRKLRSRTPAGSVSGCSPSTSASIRRNRKVFSSSMARVSASTSSISRSFRRYSSSFCSSTAMSRGLANYLSRQTRQRLLYHLLLLKCSSIRRLPKTCRQVVFGQVELTRTG